MGIVARTAYWVEWWRRFGPQSGKRALYFEQGNLRQLRDTLVGFDDEAFQRDTRWLREELFFRPSDFTQDPGHP